MKNSIPKEHAKSSGIYLIRNSVDWRVYVGSARNLWARYNQHRTTLKLGTHASKKLQKFVEEYGIDKLDFTLLEACSIDLLAEREKYYLDNLNAVKEGFNRLSTINPKPGRKPVAKNLKKTSRTLCLNQVQWDNLIEQAGVKGFDGPTELIIAKFKLDKI